VIRHLRSKGPFRDVRRAAVASICLVCIGAPLTTVRVAEAAPADQAPSTDKVETTETSGLAFSAGIGSQYPMIGVQTAYYVQMPHSLFRATPYASIGGALCTSIRSAKCTLGAAFGAMGSWGHRHRIIADVFYATVGATSLSFHGEKPDTKPRWGTGAAIGYEYMANSGFFARCDAGVTYAFGPPIYPAKDRFGIALTLIGVGYKLW
jgi:hypothetical protein